jgi:hypothetical protein
VVALGSHPQVTIALTDVLGDPASVQQIESQTGLRVRVALVRCHPEPAIRLWWVLCDSIPIIKIDSPSELR